jgi:hypothetical protein
MTIMDAAAVTHSTAAPSLLLFVVIIGLVLVTFFARRNRK